MTNLPTEIFQFILSIAGIIITLLLGAVVYFLQKWINSIDLLVASVNSLKTEMALIKVGQVSSEKSCGLQHAVIDKRLNAHSERLIEHGEAITEIKGELLTQARTNPARRNYTKKHNTEKNG